jgi:NodT family efflux transporter outer membrane factor (OMF) lipoprotein
MSISNFYRPLYAIALPLALSACAITLPETQVDAQTALQWQTPLPHQGAVVSLSSWWRQQGDPELVALIEAAQAAAPSVAQALSRIEAARALQAATRAVLLPNVNAALAGARSVSQPGLPLASSVQAGLQASWELDLVGANRAASRAAQAQVEGAQAQWHDARVSVAAEVANLYFGLHTCHALLELAQQDAASRAESARLSDAMARAGLMPSSSAALASASAAESRSRATQQAAQCDLTLKALVALTALPEPDLRQRMARSRAAPAQPTPMAVREVPAQTITQRPDVFTAERALVVASVEVGVAKAQRYPRLNLSGSIGRMRYDSVGVTTNLDTWSFGPLVLSLPVFDGGQREANVTAAQARYGEAVTLYRAVVRQAVREVEEALVNLQATQARRDDASVSERGYAQLLAATQARHAQGLASMMELEDARRLALASASAQLALQLERNRAWVALYRALGGGFAPDATTVSVNQTTVAP